MHNNEDIYDNLNELSQETEKSFQRVMDSFDKIDRSMDKTFAAMYFLYGGLVTAMIIGLAEAFLG